MEDYKIIAWGVLATIGFYILLLYIVDRMTNKSKKNTVPNKFNYDVSLPEGIFRRIDCNTIENKIKVLDHRPKSYYVVEKKVFNHLDLHHDHTILYLFIYNDKKKDYIESRIEKIDIGYDYENKKHDTLEYYYDVLYATETI